MTDLTPEERKRLREMAQQFPDAPASPTVLALLDAHDRLAEQLAIAVEALDEAVRDLASPGFHDSECPVYVVDADEPCACSTAPTLNAACAALARIAALDPKEDPDAR